MRKLFVVISSCLAMAAQGQLLDFGIIGGANFPNLKIEGGSGITDVEIESGIGYHIGAMARINLAILFIQPEFIYTNTSSDYSFKANGTEQTGTYNMQRFDIPIPVGLKLGPVGLFVGPVASFALSSPDDIFDDTYNTATWGYQAGANVKFVGFMVEAKYEGPFSDQASTAKIGGQTFVLDTRQPMWILSVGYFF